MFSSQTIYVFQRRQKFWTQKSLLDFRCSACALPAIMFLFALFWALELDSCIYLCETETLDTHSQKNVGSRTHAEILEISIIHLKYTCINERNLEIWATFPNILYVQHEIEQIADVTHVYQWNLEMWSIFEIYFMITEIWQYADVIHANQTSFIFPNTLYEIYAYKLYCIFQISILTSKS